MNDIDQQEIVDDFPQPRTTPPPPPISPEIPLWQVKPEAWADYVTALGQLQEPPKTGKVNAGQRRYTYLTLADLLEAVRTVFAAHRLAVQQDFEVIDRGVVVRTMIRHTSGALWENSPVVMPAGKSPQEIGSALTYARRYALATMVGLAGVDDDDGQAAVKPARQILDDLPPVDPQTGEILDPASSAPRQQPASTRQLKALHTLAGKAGLSHDDGIALCIEIAKRDIGGSKDLTVDEASRVIDHLKTVVDQ
jgi:hypothetical protein